MTFRPYRSPRVMRGVMTCPFPKAVRPKVRVHHNGLSGRFPVAGVFAGVYHRGMRHPRDDIELSDEELLGRCEEHVYKASGPGGQHRNKVSSAVRLHHRASGVTATANDSRSQHDNRRLALRRLRMNLALRLRKSAPAESLPDAVRDCLHRPRGGRSGGRRRLTVGRRDVRFWAIAAVLLDAMEARKGRLSEVADLLETSTGNVTSVLKQDRHLLAAAQEIRRSFGQRPIA
jgi:hypothetical protein